MNVYDNALVEDVYMCRDDDRANFFVGEKIKTSTKAVLVKLTIFSCCVAFSNTYSSRFLVVRPGRLFR